MGDGVGWVVDVVDPGGAGATVDFTGSFWLTLMINWYTIMPQADRGIWPDMRGTTPLKKALIPPCLMRSAVTWYAVVFVCDVCSLMGEPQIKFPYYSQGWK